LHEYNKYKKKCIAVLRYVSMLVNSYIHTRFQAAYHKEIAFVHNERNYFCV